MTRDLQNRLALANVKIQNGWGNLPLESIEPKIELELELKRKRPTSSSNDALSDTSSILSDRIYNPAGLASSPLTGPLFSDDLPRSGSSHSSKRSKYRSVSQVTGPNGTARTRAKRLSSHSNTSSWKRNHQLPESSPLRGRYNPSTVPILSFVTEATIPDDDISVSHSEDDDSDLPLASFNAMNRQIRSSPPRLPRTPSPDVARSARLRSKPFNGNTSRNNEDAADLLMFLAASPSPAVPSRKPRTPGPSTKTPQPPRTPPQQKTPLPSSMLSTPGGSAAHFVGMGAATPGVGGFNFSDFINVTPSPAQAAWRTPGPGLAARTPLTRDGRRTLHFEGLMPPSPTTRDTKRVVTGLGMELGPDLQVVSSQ